jgi:hypothetical protein
VKTVVLLSLLIASSAGAQTFLAGESLEYDLTWVGITGGTLRMSISPADGNRLRMTSIAESNSGFARIYKVRDEIESVASAGDFSTVEYRKHLNERGRIRDDQTIIDPVAKVATRTRPAHEAKTISITTPLYDPLSLIYHLRTLDLEPGNVHRFTVLADGKVYTLVATVLRRETIATKAGRLRCVTVEPKMIGGGIYGDQEQNRLLVSYTDDARHIPVRIRSEVKVGTITATLRKVP